MIVCKSTRRGDEILQKVHQVRCDEKTGGIIEVAVCSEPGMAMGEAKGGLCVEITRRKVVRATQVVSAVTWDLHPPHKREATAQMPPRCGASPPLL